MRSILISITSKVKWLFLGLALIGISSIFLDYPIIHQIRIIGLIGFFILLLLEIPITVLFQSLYQIVGIIYIYFYNRFKLPSKENYICKTEYILPFNGKWTVVNGGVNKILSHSWNIVSQRYAYDFIILDNNGKPLVGVEKSCNSYYCNGKDIIAPADGYVVKAIKKYNDSYVDGINAYCDALDIRGNYIIIKHNEIEYSLIAHLMKNSIAVNVGDKVKQGEIIAKCGNSGNSSMPHIHFQLQSGKGFFTSATLPISFNNINAENKGNYEFMDKRVCSGNLEIIGNKSFIGRGLEVENNIG